MRFRSWRFTAFIAMAVIASALELASQTVRAQSPNGAKRLAFVIGNGAYSGIPPLQNALNDATATRSVLQEAGFEVVPATDATLAELRGALDRFIERVREAGRGTTALVY